MKKTWLARFWTGLGLLLFLLFPFVSVQAIIGLSPPEVVVEETIAEGETVSASVAVQRGANQPGALFFETDFHGDCSQCIVGDDYLIMAADEDRAEYDFEIDPAGLEEGSYETYIAFLLYEESSAPGGVGANIVQGVTAKIQFSYEGGEGTVGGGGGGGGRRYESAEEEEEAVQEEEVSGEDGAGETVSEEEAPAEEEEAAEEEEESTPLPITNMPTATPEEPSVSAAPSEEEGQAEAELEYSLTQLAQYVLAYLTDDAAGIFDLNGNGVGDLVDILIYVQNLSWYRDGQFVAPIQSGPPLPLGQPAVLYFVEGKQQAGQYRFVLASAEAQLESLFTFYLLLDTDENGVAALDTIIYYDHELLELVGTDAAGSIFPFIRGVSAYDDAGTVRLVAASPEAFVGTRGYVMAMQFRPLAEGSVALYTEVISVLDAKGDSAYQERRAPLIGSVEDLVELEEEPIPEIAPTLLQAASVSRPEGCERFGFLCPLLYLEIALFVLAFMSLIAIFVLKQRKRR